MERHLSRPRSDRTRWDVRRNRSSGGFWSRSRLASGQALGHIAPFCSCCRNMRAHHGAIEHLNQIGRRAQAGKVLEENLKNTRLAQSGKALPDTVPMSIALRQTAPCDIVDGEMVQGLQKQSVISTLVAPPRKRDAENLKCDRPVRFCHLRQHRRSPLKPATHESFKY